jgi:hypothetical protein
MADPTASLPVLAIQAALRNVLIDRVTVETSRALAAAGVPSLVLKGPAVAQWLYDSDEVRAYGDTDLLIPHECWERAGEIFQRLGFTHDISSLAHPGMESFASDPWYRGDDNLDLHSTLFGIGEPPERVWGILSEEAMPIRLAGQELLTLNYPARAMHVAMHAAQHQDGKAVYDLERALARVDVETWQRAAALAQRLDAVPTFTGGLKLLPDGEELSRRLGVADARSIRMDLRASQVPLTESIYELSRAPGIRAKLKIFVAELFPKPAFMRWWSPLAQRGRLGLAASYLWRPIYLLIHTPAAARVVWRVRRRH